jgi:hypothetical protein
MVAKAKIIEGLAALQAFVANQKVLHNVYADDSPLSLHLRPTKRVLAVVDIPAFSAKKVKGTVKGTSSESSPPKQLLLLPLTTNIQHVKKHLSCFLKLPCEVMGTDGEEVIALGRCYQDPLTSTAEKPGVVELFWEVKKISNKEDCNMELIECQVCSGEGVTVPGLTMGQLPPRKDVIYAMVPSRNIKRGDELVLHFVDEGEKPIKRARV